jgi:23S rRNA pseudouridine1911/1915/1917 synthase
MHDDYEHPIGPWMRRHAQGAVHKIDAAALARWVLHVDERIIVLNKSGELPCHPSKDGPWSSLAGAVREYFGATAAHLVFRLDRETSGVVVFARDEAMARYAKSYLAILNGELRAELTVSQPLGDDLLSKVAIKSRVVAPGRGQNAITRFAPLLCGGGFTLARVTTETGRKHQIRVHAQWLGHALVGDKIYGPDPALFLEFIESGWSDALAAKLLLRRQALHCAEIDLRAAGVDKVFRAPLPDDMRAFCGEWMRIGEENF